MTTKTKTLQPLVAILMGSTSDMEQMSRASKKLEDLGIDREVARLESDRAIKPPSKLEVRIDLASTAAAKVLANV